MYKFALIRKQCKQFTIYLKTSICELTFANTCLLINTGIFDFFYKFKIIEKII